MQRSKFRTSVRSLICPELRRRVDLHVTKYRSGIHTKSGMITVDGERVIYVSYYLGMFTDPPELMPWAHRPSGYQPEPDEIFSPQHLGYAMRAYLDIPVKLALKSKNPFLRAFAIIDRRIGRRTLEQLEIGDTEHDLVREFYRLRMASLSA